MARGEAALCGRKDGVLLLLTLSFGLFLFQKNFQTPNRPDPVAQLERHLHVLQQQNAALQLQVQLQVGM